MKGKGLRENLRRHSVKTGTKSAEVIDPAGFVGAALRFLPLEDRGKQGKSAEGREREGVTW